MDDGLYHEHDWECSACANNFTLSVEGWACDYDGGECTGMLCPRCATELSECTECGATVDYGELEPVGTP